MNNTRFSWIFFCLSLLFFYKTNSLIAENSVHSFGKYQISLPATFEFLPVTQPDTILVARSRDTVFPTFNIIKIAGSYDFSRKTADLLESIEQSYRQVGIQSAAIVSGSVVHQPYPMLEATVAYDSMGTRYRSLVFVVSDSDNHFIGTLLAPEEIFNSKKSEFRQILSGIKSSASQINSQLGEQATTFPVAALFLIAMLLILALGTWYLIRKKQ